MAADKNVPAAPTDAAAGIEHLTDLNVKIRGLAPQIGDKTITLAIIGAGSRGNVYAKYAELFPDKVKLVAVSDINDFRLKRICDKFEVGEEMRFGDFHTILSQPKLADALLIALPDDLHYEACMLALDKGYDVLLEKPMAQTEKEVRNLLSKTRKTGRIVATCHVLRYAPYFIALRAAVQGGLIGDLVSIQHMEPIAYDHMAHSYVRGNWHDSKATTPIILAKSCHDLDIIRWIVGKPCTRVSAEGSLSYFKAENAPEGAPMRCTDGCPHESTCPYSAIDLYADKRRRISVLDLKTGDRDEIIQRLKETDYGRCVFHCNNDQPDHYICDLLFEDGVTASFSMEAFSPWGGRRTRIMGTKGFIEGDMNQFILWDFKSGKKKIWTPSDIMESDEYKDAGHGGGDLVLFRDFVEAVALQDYNRLTSNIEASVESHVMGFRCEKSRLSGRKAKVKM